MNTNETVDKIYDDLSSSYGWMSSALSLGGYNYFLDKTVQNAITYLAYNQGVPLRILDVSCKTGKMIEKWKKNLAKNHFNEFNIKGTEVSSKMVDLAKKKYPENEVFLTPANDLPIENDSLDVVSSAYGVRNFTDDMSAYEEIFRVLKKDGIFVVLDYFSNFDPTIAGKARDLYVKKIAPFMANRIFSKQEASDYMLRRVDGFDSSCEMQAKLEHVGFEVVYLRSFPLGFSHCIIAKKTTGTRTATSKPVKIAKKKPSKKVYSSDAQDIVDAKQLPYYRALKTVTMKCFVKYYKYFAMKELSTKDIIKKIYQDENYTKESCHSRISNGRFIINNGYAKEALEYITNANRADEETRKKAKRLLKALTSAE